MHLLIRTILLILMIAISSEGFTQLIRNPSFEGTPAENVPPPPWTSCNTYSTPDTQPGFWNVTKTASNGNTYLGLVTRGNLGPYANNNEAAQIQLSTTLIAGWTYQLSIDLALSETLGHDIGWEGFLSYANPAILKIWGGVNSCEKTELLWESPAINHTDWKTYDFMMKPQLRQINYLILEANYTALPSYFGNILIDNISEKSQQDPCIEKPTVKIGNDTTLCLGETLILDASVDGAEYTWQDTSKAPTFQVTTAGIYWVDVIKNNCTIRDSIIVNYKQPAIDLGKDTTLCEGQILTLDVSSASGPYLWSDGSTASSLNVSESGKYWLKAYSNGCQATDTIIVSFEAPFKINLMNDTTICNGQSIVLQVSVQGKTFLWSDHSTDSSIEVSEEGIYWVDVQSGRCVVRDSIQIRLTDCLTDIPNIITPNGDDKNDTFVIKEIQKDRWEMLIVDRLGNQVYKTLDYKNNWSGDGLPTGVYFYRLINQTSRKSYKGWIHILY